MSKFMLLQRYEYSFVEREHLSKKDTHAFLTAAFTCTVSNILILLSHHHVLSIICSL